MDTFEIILGIDYGKTTPARWGLLPSVVSELQYPSLQFRHWVAVFSVEEASGCLVRELVEYFGKRGKEKRRSS